MFVPKLNSVKELDKGMDAYVLHFSIETINTVIGCLPEFQPLNQILINWKRGMIFKNVKK